MHLLVILPEEIIENGDRLEVEIRGCTIWAVEAINFNFLLLV